MEWKKLPNEMKEMVVQRSTQATRNALKCCSWSSQQLVEKARLNAIYYLEIQFPNSILPKWQIGIRARPESQLVYEKFESLEEFNSRVLKIVKSARCIQKLAVHSLPAESKTPFKLRSSERQPTALIERVVFLGDDDIQPMNVLSQMEPGFLRSVYLPSDGGNSAIYDMPQIIHAEKVSVTGPSSIKEWQLLNLNASNVQFRSIDCSVRKFIDRCAREAGTKPRRFIFRGANFKDMGLKKLAPKESNQKVLRKTAHPHLKMELIFGRNEPYVIGSIQNNSQRYSTNLWQFGCPSSFRVIEELDIMVHANGLTYINISRPTYSTVSFVFKNHEKFQQKMDEIMENVDFIKDFKINMENAKEKMIWKPRRENNLLMVKYLDVVGYNSITSIQDLLELIDPNYAMSSVNIREAFNLADNSLLFDTPQIRNAAEVRIRNPFIRNEQLLVMKAKIIECQNLFEEDDEDEDYDFSANTPLTKAGINQYIKKLLRNLDNENMSFVLGRMRSAGTCEAMFEGLEIMKTAVKDEGTEWAINTTNPKFVLVVRLSRRETVSGKLVPRSEI